MMLRFFLIDWIMNYLNTPELQRTPADVLLFYAALGIILCIIWALWFAYLEIKEIKERKNKK